MWAWGDYYKFFGNTFDAAAAKKYYAELSASILASTPADAGWGSALARGSLASLVDLVGGYIPGKGGNQGQNIANVLWGLGLGGLGAIARSGSALATACSVVDVGRNFGGALINASQGDYLSAATSIVSMSGSHFGEVATRFEGFASNATKFQGRATDLGLHQAAERFGNLATNHSFRQLDYTEAQFVAKGISKAHSGYKALVTLDQFQLRPNTPAAHASGPINDGKVGGVLLNKAATCALVGMQIEAAYWDNKTASLVLVSRKGDTLAGPTLDIEHLRIALRAALAGEPLGVSIDPPAEYRRRNSPAPPAGTAMHVSYLGSTRGTAFGAIMFEADRVLKCLTKGVDNETGRPRRVDVPGFRTLLERLCLARDQSSGSWHRFWFVIDDVTLTVDSRSKVLRFDTVRLKVLNERELGDAATQTTMAPGCDREFAQHFSEKFELYAEQEPSLARLKEIAQITALAQYLVRACVPVDLSGLYGRVPLPVQTPDMTPAIVASQSINGDGYLQLIGGVDLDASPTIHEIVEPELAALQTDCEANRPGRNARVWTTGAGNNRRIAFAVPLGRPTSPFTATSEDHQFLGGDLRLRRHYDSSDNTGGDFGPGWRLSVPYRLTLVESSRKRQEVDPRMTSVARPRVILLHEQATGTTVRYLRVKGHMEDEVYARLHHQMKHVEALSYSIAEGDTILIDGSGYRLRRHGTSYQFTSEGALERIEPPNGQATNYAWDGPLLRGISNGRGNSYKIGRDGVGRVARVENADALLIAYNYDQAGLLVAVHRNSALKSTYRYDEQDRLAEIRDHTGTIVRRAVYNDGGDVGGRPERIFGNQGAWLERSFVSERLASVSDHRGWRATYGYSPKGDIQSVELSDGHKAVLTLAYDAAGRLWRVLDRMGTAVDLTYDGDAIKMLTRSDGSRVTFDAGTAARTCTLENAHGEKWAATFVMGALSMLSGPADHFLHVVKRTGRHQLRSSAGNWCLWNARNQTRLKASLRGGISINATFGQEYSVIRSKNPCAERRRSEIRTQEGCAVLKDPAGTIQWQRTNEDSTVRISMNWV